jgi:hypothetical protein
MTKHPIEVITSVERRRPWSREEKEVIAPQTSHQAAGRVSGVNCTAFNRLSLLSWPEAVAIETKHSVR